MKKENEYIRTLKNIALILSVLFSVIVLSVISAGTQENKALGSIQPKSLSQAPSVACQPLSGSQSTVLRAEEITNRLTECINNIESEHQKRSAALNAAQGPRTSQTNNLRSQLGEELDIRFHPVSGVPRQMKVKPESKSKGVVLGRAAQTTASGRDKDEKTARDFLRSRRGLLHISKPDEELRLSRYSNDELARRHLRYDQVYHELPVWPAQLNIHLDASGNVDLMNGVYVPTPRRLVVKPVWDAAAAIRQARSAVTGGQNARAGAPELIVYAPGDRIPRLAWKIELEVSIESKWLTVIDALNGKTLTSYNQVMKENAFGSGTDLFGNKRQLNVWHEGNQYYMLDTSKSMYNATSNPPNGVIKIYDMHNNDSTDNADLVASSTSNSGWLPDAVSLAWCLSKTYDYYLARQNRSSFDGEGSSIVGFVRDGNEPDNAYFSTDLKTMFFGDNQPFAGALDVVAHEFTHGVTDSEVNLIYQNQPGALSEAFSDVFGEMVEAYALGHADWIIGTSLADKIRDIKNPSHQEIDPGSGKYYPSKMSEFYVTPDDNGGVHLNCTIISHCYYLLSEGMQGAIGLQDAERIFYRAQKYHLVANSQFVDCRLACIASAEELFGQNSSQVQKVVDAFDAVEIYDSAQTPEPPSAAPVNSEDSVMSISYSSHDKCYYLTRRENALGDSSLGAWISCRAVDFSRPSVSGDGSLAFFVNSDNDACFINTNTDGTDCEECLGFPGQISSVAMSPDSQLYGFVLLDDSGERTNSITVADLRPGGQAKTYTLVSPSIDGVALDTVQFADAMDFSSDDKYLFYDAYNVLQFSDGTKIGVWSIYAIDLKTEQTLSLFGPLTGVDVGFPAISQTTNHLMTFDMLDETTENSNIVAVNLISGDYGVIGTVAGAYGIPGYTGDDSAIVYTAPDLSTVTGFSLMQQPLAQDHITPTGATALYMKDAAYGVIYRRGNFTAPSPLISISPGSLDFGTVFIGDHLKKEITISNTGTGDLSINEISISGANASQYTIDGGCAGQSLPASGTCKFYIDFSPTSAGTKNATLSISSNDPKSPESKVRITGGGGTPNNPPSNLSARAISSTQIVLGWKDNSNNESGFKIEQKTGACNSAGTWTQIAAKPANSTTHTVSGLSSNKTYGFRVRAYQSSTNSSYSNCASAKTGLSKTPPAPSNFKATSVSSTTINLSWSDNSTNETGFKIYRKAGSGSWTLLKTTGANAKNYSDTTATGNNSSTTYQYYLVSYNASGNSPPTNTAIVPYKPVNLTASPDDSTSSIALSWTDKSSNETNFEIYRKAGACSSANAWSLVGRAGANTQIWMDPPGLNSGETYSYRVRAVNKSAVLPNAYGYSVYTNCSTATAP